MLEAYNSAGSFGRRFCIWKWFLGWPRVRHVVYLTVLLPQTAGQFGHRMCVTLQCFAEDFIFTNNFAFYPFSVNRSTVASRSVSMSTLLISDRHGSFRSVPKVLDECNWVQPGQVFSLIHTSLGIFTWPFAYSYSSSYGLPLPICAVTVIFIFGILWVLGFFFEVVSWEFSSPSSPDFFATTYNLDHSLASFSIAWFQRALFLSRGSCSVRSYGFNMKFMCHLASSFQLLGSFAAFEFSIFGQISIL